MDMENFNLDGTIPESLVNMQYLEIFDCVKSPCVRPTLVCVFSLVEYEAHRRRWQSAVQTYICQFHTTTTNIYQRAKSATATAAAAAVYIFTLTT